MRAFVSALLALWSLSVFAPTAHAQTSGGQWLGGSAIQSSVQV